MSSASILIVDDQPDLAQMLQQLLRNEGFEARVASSGQEAIASVLADPPHLVLLDVSMPGIDGFAVAKMLKADPATATIPIIMVSAQVGRGARVIGLESGAEDYLTKPVDTVELLLKIRNLLRLRKRTERAVRAEAPPQA
jgi:DNA-binding response OmpR family regulator